MPKGQRHKTADAGTRPALRSNAADDPRRHRRAVHKPRSKPLSNRVGRRPVYRGIVNNRCGNAGQTLAGSLSTAAHRHLGLGHHDTRQKADTRQMDNGRSHRLLDYGLSMMLREGQPRNPLDYYWPDRRHWSSLGTMALLAGAPSSSLQSRPEISPWFAGAQTTSTLPAMGHCGDLGCAQRISERLPASAGSARGQAPMIFDPVQQRSSYFTCSGRTAWCARRKWRRPPGGVQLQQRGPPRLPGVPDGASPVQQPTGSAHPASGSAGTQESSWSR